MEKNTIFAISLSTVVLVGFFAAQTFLFPNNNAGKQASQQNVAEENGQTQDETSSSEKTETGSLIVAEQNPEETLEEENFTITTDKV